MLQREAELRDHPAIQRALDVIEINSQGHFHSSDKNNCTIDDDEYEAVLRHIARMKSGELKAQLRQLGVNSKGSTATCRSDHPIENPHLWSAPVHPFELLNVEGTGLSWDDTSGAALTRMHSASVEMEFVGRRVCYPTSSALAIFLIH